MVGVPVRAGGRTAQIEGKFAVRKCHQLQILELLATVREAQAAGLYDDCQYGAQAITEFIEQQDVEGTVTVALLDEYCHLLHKAHDNEVDQESLLRQLCRIVSSVKTELKPKKYKVLFLPYYDNTWETMKSLYEAFSRDPLFETEVVITPIVRNTNQGAKFVWDDYLTSNGIPNTHYEQYSFEIDRPDIVFYNQPYDEVNVPKFSSDNIRRYSTLMVYVPYHLKLVDVSDPSYDTRVNGLGAIQRCDLYICQSAHFRERYLKGTPLYKKALVHGHPKCDILFSAKNDKESIYDPDWRRKMEGHRVILLNTHYSQMISGALPHPGVRRLLETVEHNDDLFLLWRPHPQSFLMKMSPQMMSMLELAEKHKRMIVDRTPNMTRALIHCDALVSTSRTSIVVEALFLDVPTFVLGRNDFQANTPSRGGRLFYNSVAHENFCEPLPDKATASKDMRAYIEANVYAPLDSFVQDIRNGLDSRAEERKRFREQEFPYGDGAVAGRILQSVKNMIL